MESQLEKIGTRECRLFASAIFAKHGRVDKYLKSAYVREARSRGHVEANRMLADYNERLRWHDGFSAAMGDEELRMTAGARSGACESMFNRLCVRSDLDTAIVRVREYVESNGLVFPSDIKKKDSAKVQREKCLGAVARVSDAKWWRRQLRVSMSRQVESVLRDGGNVCAKKSPYVSNWTLSRWRSSTKANKDLMSQMEAVSEEGEVVPMLDCIEASVSNPVNRRHELMVRMRGTEEVATAMGLMGLFFTLTAPSKFHATLKSGRKNPNFGGYSVSDTVDYLNDVWARIRAAWHRRGIRSVGFRIAEPHHDGTPHYHFLLFVHPDEVERCCQLFGEYALAMDTQEAGALENRWDVKKILPQVGTAAAYVAKYVAKNVDGDFIENDFESGKDGKESAARVRAWASVWGVRQFQQIGSVSVTVWRELRRVKGALEDWDHEEAEQIRLACTEGDWARFVELMGGAFVRRDEQVLRPRYLTQQDKANRYGEPLERLIGVWLQCVGRAISRRLIVTREQVWQIRRREAVAVQKAAPPLSLDLYQ